MSSATRPPELGLTHAEEAIIGAAVLLTAANGYPPAYREIAEEVGYGLHTVHRALHSLRSRGLVSFEDGRPRTLRVLV